MLKTMIMYGIFPLPPTSNSLYETVYLKHGGTRRRLSDTGQNFKTATQYLLTHGPEKKEDSHQIYIDGVEIAAVRQRYASFKKNRRKFAPPEFSLTCLYVYEDRRRDIDGAHKIFQDSVFEWLSCNDNCVAHINMLRCVDPTVPPHSELKLYECEVDWKSGDVFASALEEIAFLNIQQENPYNALTEVNRTVNYPAM